MIRTIQLLALLLAMLFCASAATASEQRVLLSFDGSGHRVERILKHHGAESLMPGVSVRQGVTEFIDSPALLADVRTGFATLVWLDDSGVQQLAVTTEPDPRLSHGPSHIDGSSESRFGELTGAWLVSGPAGATNLIILLPADQSLGLGEQRWELALKVAEQGN